MIEVDVFARNEDEMYAATPVAKTASTKTFHQVLRELSTQHFRHAAMPNLIAEAADLKFRMEAIISESSQTMIAQLEERHEASIAEQRKAEAALAAAKAATFKALQEQTRLDGIAKAAGDRLGKLSDAWKDADKALLTRAEKTKCQADIEAARKRAEGCALAESAQFSVYRNKVTAEREATLAFNEATSKAVELGREIERLERRSN
jgi:hypothetical protein